MFYDEEKAAAFDGAAPSATEDTIARQASTEEPWAQRYLRAAPRAADVAALNRLTHQLIGAFGFTAFGLTGIATPGAPVAPRGFFCSRTNGWREAYVASGCHSFDPAIRRILANNGPFTWSSLRAEMRDRDQDRLFGVAADFAFRDGVIVPTLGRRGEINAVVMLSDGRLELDIADLALLGACAHTYATCGLALVGSYQADNTRLGRRERQCLAWVARGKSDSVTADILGLSEKTVRMFVDSARRKLGAATRWQAVMTAWQQGWLLDEAVEPASARPPA